MAAMRGAAVLVLCGALATCSAEAEARKCCPLGERYEGREGCKRSLAPEELWRGYRVLVGRPTCPPEKPTRTRASYFTERLHLEPDGSLMLRMPHALFPLVRHTADEYCLDTFLTEGEDGEPRAHLDALVCFPEDIVEDNTLAMTGMMVSCVFLLLTLAVYVFVPELRNMHGRVLMAYLCCLLIGFLFLSTLQLLIHLSEDGSDPSVCFPFTFVIYWSLLAAFFWLNVMCFDIWWTFSGMGRVRRSHTFARRRYAAYCAYAFGWPTALTAVLAALELTSDTLPEYIVTPRMREQGCFLYGDAKLLYLYFPMLILCIANTLLFILTALRIASVRRQTAVLKQGDSATHDQFRKDKQRLLLYLKLFAVMGINWALEVVSSLFPRVPVLWKLTDAYNVLIGLTIFIIFICKRKIFRLIRKRYEVVVHGVVPSRSHTCSTRNTSSMSREELRLPPLASSAPAVAQPPHGPC